MVWCYGREGFVRVWGLKSTKCVVAGFVGWRSGGGLWVLVVVWWWAWCLFGVVLWRRGFCLGFGYEARVRFETRVRVRVRVRDSAIFEKVGCGCGGTRRLKNY